MLKSADNIHKRSKKQERLVAKEVGGRVVKASGALWYQKGDVEHEQFLIECKSTTDNSYSLKLDTIHKIMDEGMAKGKEAILQLDFAKVGTRVGIIAWPTLQLMLKDAETSYEQGQRIELLENCIKFLTYRLFEKETVEHTDEVFAWLSQRLSAAAKDPSVIPDIDVKI